LINQLKVDFIDGREENNADGPTKSKPALINPKYQENITVRVFHSDAEKIEQQTDELLENVGEIEEEYSGQGNDSFTFSTFQTAVKGLPIKQPNIIIVDEAHHLAAPTYYQTFLHFYTPDKDGKYPLVLLMTATPNKILHLVENPLVEFGLPERIMSEYSPEVKYTLITNSNATKEDIDRLDAEIERISQIEDIKEKKKQIKILKEGEDGNGGINAMLKRYNSNEDLVAHLLDKLESLDHTIIFCPSIEIVEQVVRLINDRKGNDTAQAFHSKIDEMDSEILQKYTSGQCKVIVAVGKLNEGIDMPQTKNVVFWRETDSETVFQQQFGRGLRGDEVQIFDYVGGIKNLPWINGINQAIEEIHLNDTDEEDDIDEDSEERVPRKNKSDLPPKHISIVTEGVGDLGGAKAYDFNLGARLMKVEELDREELTQEMIEEFFKSKSLEEWKIMRIEERRKLKIGGYGLVAISSFYGIK
jgi:superfamily II DNA or RNA helicase